MSMDDRSGAGADRPGDAAPGIGTDRWGEALGLVVDEVTDERVVAHVEADERHHQPYGVLHGGVWCSVVEAVASIGAGSLVRKRGGAGVLGVCNQTDFLRSHSHGRIDAVGTPLHTGRRQHLWEVHITRASDGVLVSRGQVRFQVLDVLPADRERATGG